MQENATLSTFGPSLDKKNTTFLEWGQSLKSKAQDDKKFCALFSYLAHYWGGVFPLTTYAPQNLEKYKDAVFALAMTEPQGGSRPWEMNTVLSEVDGSYFLQGKKTLITNATFATHFVVYAKSEVRQEFFILVVDKDTANLQVRPLSIRGFTDSGMGEVDLQQCKLSAENLLTSSKLTRSVFQESMNGERITIMALCVGRMESVYQQSLRFCKERKIQDFGLIQQRLLHMNQLLTHSEYTLARALTALDQRKNLAQTAAICKVEISENYLALTQEALRIFAGQGLLSGHSLENDLNWALAATVFSGANDVLKNLAAKLL